MMLATIFQSTRPLRGATLTVYKHDADTGISIHAPLAGRDLDSVGASRPAYHFNPRAPCGARRSSVIGLNSNRLISIHAPLAGRDPYLARSSTGRLLFQSTRPLRGATAKVHKLLYTLLRKKQGFNCFCEKRAFQSAFPPVDKRKSLKSRCEPPWKFLRTATSHYKIIGSSGK